MLARPSEHSSSVLHVVLFDCIKLKLPFNPITAETHPKTHTGSIYKQGRGSLVRRTTLAPRAAPASSPSSIDDSRGGGGQGRRWSHRGGRNHKRQGALPAPPPFTNRGQGGGAGGAGTRAGRHRRSGHAAGRPQGDHPRRRCLHHRGRFQGALRREGCGVVVGWEKAPSIEPPIDRAPAVVACDALPRFVRRRPGQIDRST